METKDYVYQERLIIAKWLEKRGFEFEKDSDGLWLENYNFADCRTKEVIDLLIEIRSYYATTMRFNVFSDLWEIMDKYENAFTTDSPKLSPDFGFFTREDVFNMLKDII